MFSKLDEINNVGTRLDKFGRNRVVFANAGHGHSSAWH